MHTKKRQRQNNPIISQPCTSQRKSCELLNKTKMEPKSATKQQQKRTLLNNVINTGKGNKNSTLKVKNNTDVKLTPA